MDTNNSLIYTTENCIGCNRCVSVCSSNGASRAVVENGKHRIRVDADRCVACGACLDVCEHKAREFRDDTERFFEDLQNGKQISVLIAPAFKANYPNEYSIFLGYIRSCGANQFINVSFGADITTWGYLNYIKKYDFKGGISQPCPAVVAYIEKHLPNLIDNLIPVQSPLMCAAIYAKKYLGITDDLAFISPCIAKKMEIDDPVNEGRIKYNVTFKHLIQYIKSHPKLPSSYKDETEYGLGSIYPIPGGLKENIRWFLGEDAFVRQMDGEKRMYKYLEKNQSIIKNKVAPFLLVDALNCSEGCIYGTGCDPVKNNDDFVSFSAMKIRSSIKNANENSPWNPSLSTTERLELLNDRFKDLDLNDYLRTYTDQSANCQYNRPTSEELDAIFTSMGKIDDIDRKINCSSCGYDSCTQMAEAIHNGFTSKENCVNYLRHEVLEEAKKRAATEASNEAKSVFLTNMSHEIRTPLNGVLGMNSIILHESSEPGVIKCAEDIDMAGKTLLSIINNILDISKIEAGSFDMTENDYHLPSVIRECYIINSHLAHEKCLDFTVNFAKPIPCNLHGDEIHIRQILNNLISNGVKYTENGFVSINVDWDKLEDNNIVLYVSVEDSGQGIKPENINGLFQSFKRLNEKVNRTIQGTGLGLPISKYLAELMGGSITVESVYGKGSKFTVSVNQKLLDDETTDDLECVNKGNSAKNDISSFKAPNARILAVDDTSVNLRVLKGLLKATEITVDLAESGAKALEFTKSTKYDLILMDHMMPEMDGEETMKRIRVQEGGLNKRTPIMVQTANAMRGAIEQYLGMGFVDYISKPLNPTELLKKVKRILQ